MFPEIGRKARTCIGAAATVVALAGVVVVPSAMARVVRNTIDPLGVVSDDGRHLVVTGPIQCDAGQKVFVTVTVTQRTTGAVAEGFTRIACSGESQQWEVHAAAKGREVFEEGLATAVALARTSDRGDSDDAHQWLVEITLIAD
jgi:hypothetical protein